MRIEGSARAPALCYCCVKGTFIVSNFIVLHTGEQGVRVLPFVTPVLSPNNRSKPL